MRQTIALGDLAWSKFLAILAVCTLVFSVFGSTAAHADANDDGSGMSPPELTSVVPVDGAPGSCHATFQTMNRGGGEGDVSIRC